MFIALEGIDGSGKSTQIQNLKIYYEEKGYRVLTIRQPGQTRMGNLIRSLIIESTDLFNETDLFLFLASHIQGLKELLLKSSNYDIILCDRTILSTAAYQGCLLKNINSYEIIKFYNQITANFLFDYLFYLDLDYEIGFSRTLEKDKFIKRGSSYLKSVYLEYQNLINQNIDKLIARNFEKIEISNLSIEEISNTIIKRIKV